MKSLKEDIAQRPVTKSNLKTRTINAFGGKQSFQLAFWFSKHFTETFQTSFHKLLSIKGNNHKLKKFSGINDVDSHLSNTESKPHPSSS